MTLLTGLRERREHDPAEREPGQPVSLPEVGRAVRGHVGGVIILTLHDLHVIRVYICMQSNMQYKCMVTPRLGYALLCTYVYVYSTLVYVYYTILFSFTYIYTC